MKNLFALLLIAVTAHTFAVAGDGQTTGQPEAKLDLTLSKPHRPKFDDFLQRLHNCKGVVRALAQWSKVVKPALQDLGYTEEQIKSIKQALTRNLVTLEHATLFSEKWLARHGERLIPSQLLECLSRENNSRVGLKVAVN